jgi:hypothetical protein
MVVADRPNPNPDPYYLEKLYPSVRMTVMRIRTHRYLTRYLGNGGENGLHLLEVALPRPAAHSRVPQGVRVLLR